MISRADRKRRKGVGSSDPLLGPPQPVTFWIIRSFHGYDGMSPKILGPFMTPEAAHHYAERDVRGDYIVKPLDAFMRRVPNEEPGVQGESPAAPG